MSRPGRSKGGGGRGPGAVEGGTRKKFNLRGFARVVLNRLRDPLDLVSGFSQVNERDEPGEFDSLYPPSGTSPTIPLPHRTHAKSLLQREPGGASKESWTWH